MFRYLNILFGFGSFSKLQQQQNNNNLFKTTQRLLSCGLRAWLSFDEQ